MNHWFTQAFQEHSILWLLISALLGGIIGAGIKLLFENVFAVQIGDHRSARLAIRKYNYPLLRSAESLNRYIELLLHNIDKKWFDDKEDNYFKLALLYQFSDFFGWINILEEEAFLEYEASSKRDVRQFNICFYDAIQCLNSFRYFIQKENPVWSTEEIEKGTLHKMIISAIGELMMVTEGKENTKRRTATFLEFVDLYSVPKNRRWFDNLERFLSELSGNTNRDVRINRLIAFAINQRLLIYFLDPKGVYTKTKLVEYLPMLHPSIAKKLKKDMEQKRFLDGRDYENNICGQLTNWLETGSVLPEE
jgi:hypothetical protein